MKFAIRPEAISPSSFSDCSIHDRRDLTYTMLVAFSFQGYDSSP